MSNLDYPISVLTAAATKLSTKLSTHLLLGTESVGFGLEMAFQLKGIGNAINILNKKRIKDEKRKRRRGFMKIMKIIK